MANSKKGRPTTSPKNDMLRIRVDIKTLEKLDYCVKIDNSNRSVIVRKGIEKVFDDLKK